MWYRSALHKHLIPSLYPIKDNEAIYCPHVKLTDGTHMDFIACPGIKMPNLTDENRLYPEDVERLEKKIAYYFPNGLQRKA